MALNELSAIFQIYIRMELQKKKLYFPIFGMNSEVCGLLIIGPLICTFNRNVRKYRTKKEFLTVRFVTYSQR